MSGLPAGRFSMGWGLAALGLLAGAYVVAAAQIPPPSETGIRVIPWQAPDLEISNSTPDQSTDSIPQE